MTETEQLEEIKKWWLKHQSLITILLSLVLITVAGSRYWNWHVEKTMQQASTAYDNMMLASTNNDDKATQSYANQLINDYSQTVYATAAHLTLAKVFVKSKDYKKATDELSQVAQHAKVETLRQLATLRLARLLIAQKNYDNALTELASLEKSPYTSIVNQLKGDIFVAKGDYSKASALYQAAIKELQTQGVSNLYLEMKRNAVVSQLV